MPRQIRLELLDAVDEVRPFAPDELEALGDVRQQIVDCMSAVAEQSTLQLLVPDLDRGH